MQNIYNEVHHTIELLTGVETSPLLKFEFKFFLEQVF